MDENVIRREKLFKEMKEDSIAVLFAGASKICSEDELYKFKANRHFFYLTNIEQENSILMLIKGLGENKIYLFVDEYDEVKEKWTGKRLTFDEAGGLSSIQNVYASSSFESMLQLALANKDNQYGEIKTLYLDLTPELKIKNQISTLSFKKEILSHFPHIMIEDVYPMVTKLRMVKSPFEIDEMKKAIHLTNLAIQDLLANMKPGMYEYELADRFEFFGRKNNRSELAFASIVASGVNATCLHYPQQEAQIGTNDLVLFDVGLNHNGYNADISRTYPVNGYYCGDQKIIYEIVLKCNKAVIEYSRAGITVKDLQDFASEFMKNELVKAGLMTPDEDIRKYYYHNVSHFLGIDTHDCGDRSIPLVPGNVITVEPGLYFKEKGIGVRIEDDVLITDSASIVLSDEIKKEIKDIETLLGSKK